MRLVFDDEFVQTPISDDIDIDKSGLIKEFILQRNVKEKNPYDIENPNPYWTNSNDDFGQYVELSKSSSPNLGRGTKRKYKKRKTYKRHKKTHKKNRK